VIYGKTRTRYKKGVKIMTDLAASLRESPPMAPKDYHQTPLFHIRMPQEGIDYIKTLANQENKSNGDIVMEALECLKAKRAKENANLQ
jgi:hypothetical protein